MPKAKCHEITEDQIKYAVLWRKRHKPNGLFVRT